MTGTQKDIGSFTHYLRLETNQPRSPTRIPVRGYVEQPVGFSPPAVALREILPGDAAEIVVPLDLSAGVHPDSLHVRVPDKAPLTAEIGKVGEGLPALVVRWRGSPDVGWHRHQIDVMATSAKNGVASPFHVAVEVVPEMDVVPQELTLPRDEWEAGTWTRRLKIKFRRPFDGRFEVAWTEPSLGQLFEVKMNPQDNDPSSLFLRLTGNGPTDRVRSGAVLQMTFSHDRKYQVPIAFIEAPNGSPR